MSEILKDLAHSLGIDPVTALVTLAVLSLLCAAVAFAYKENLFGVKNKLRRLLKAEPEDTPVKDIMAAGSGEGVLHRPLPAQPVVEESLVSTSSVHFTNERLPNPLDLQRAVHFIAGTARTPNIPFHYDAQIAFLRQRVESLYDHYEGRLAKEGGKGSLEDFSSLKLSIDFARNGLASLPKTVGLAVKRLSCERRESFNDILITQTCSRFIELRMTQILSCITRFQFSNEAPILLRYARLGRYQEYVALVDGIAMDALVSYRMQFIGDTDERVVYAPGRYGNRSLLLLDEFNGRGKGYIPPISFMTQYCYPQMLLERVDEPDKWNFELRCESIHVKNLGGDYIYEYRSESGGDPKA